MVVVKWVLFVDKSCFFAKVSFVSPWNCITVYLACVHKCVNVLCCLSMTTNFQ
jgi:hypothetical protein